MICSTQFFCQVVSKTLPFATQARQFHRIHQSPLGIQSMAPALSITHPQFLCSPKANSTVQTQQTRSTKQKPDLQLWFGSLIQIDSQSDLSQQIWIFQFFHTQYRYINFYELLRVLLRNYQFVNRFSGVGLQQLRIILIFKCWGLVFIIIVLLGTFARQNYMTLRPFSRILASSYSSVSTALIYRQFIKLKNCSGVI